MSRDPAPSRNPATPKSSASISLGACAKQAQRQTLREEGERQLVLLVAERGRELLEDRFLRAVPVGEARESLRLSPEPELRGGLENTPHFFLRQIAQRRVAAPGSRERQAHARADTGQSRRVHLHLRDVALRARAAEEIAPAFLDKDVQHGVVECRIRRVPVRFPALIYEIELDICRA